MSFDTESGDSLVAGKPKQKGKDWKAEVKGALKAELKRRDLSYADLADRLKVIGVEDNERNISNKIGRATFTAVFLFQCLQAIGCKTLHLDES
jgi:hypothetical protein